MSPVPPPGKALVTGANGYVAVWVVRRLLEDGYSVRGTVRSADKATHLRELFRSYGDKLELVVVPDITEDGAFDEAVKGIDLVEHTASPFTYQADKADDLIAPALKGTTGILNSIKKNGSSVKRVVITGSVASVFNPFVAGPSDRAYDERDWNDSSVEAVTKDPVGTSGLYWYPASKTLGEKVAWEFLEKNKSSVNFDLVVILPSYVFGPALHEVKKPMQLNQSLREIYQYVLKTNDTLPAPEGVYACIDVRDLADAHVLSAKKPEAANNRLITSGPSFVWQDIIDIAAKSNVVEADKVVQPTPKSDKNSKPFGIKSEKAEKMLGLKWTSLEDTIKDSIADFRAKSFI
ncbi:D-lactaldehyde dehydrogenase [Dentipellis sp. KUC8613]|nr:D-lactaldehyde dehydrogenase [Dentipellis sp. KUC8613]